MSRQESSHRHPYASYAGSPQWRVIDRALLELAENRDLVETTAHDHIVGYLCKALANTASTEDELEAKPQATYRSRRDALHRVREAVNCANPANRDLVQELMEERRLEAESE